jgi:hypothetical protein
VLEEEEQRNTAISRVERKDILRGGGNVYQR